VIYEIDSVLQVPIAITPTLGNISLTSELGILGTVIAEYGGECVGCTFFVPSVAALAAAPSSNLSLQEASSEGYTYKEEAFGKVHIVEGIIWYVENGETTLTADYGSPIILSSDGGSSFGQHFKFVVADVPLQDGVLHIIDK
jgi:hypothetical protein